MTTKKEDIENLITEVQKHPSIWNKEENDYKDKAKKRALWNEIGLSVGLTGL